MQLSRSLLCKIMKWADQDLSLHSDPRQWCPGPSRQKGASFQVSNRYNCCNPFWVFFHEAERPEFEQTCYCRRGDHDGDKHDDEQEVSSTLQYVYFKLKRKLNTLRFIRQQSLACWGTLIFCPTQKLSSRSERLKLWQQWGMLWETVLE